MNKENQKLMTTEEFQNYAFEHISTDIGFMIRNWDNDSKSLEDWLICLSLRLNEQIDALQCELDKEKICQII